MMILHLAQAATETPPAPTSNPVYILVGAVIAGVVALVVALISNWRADVREVEKTRREVLTTAVSSMIEKSDDRYQSIGENSFINSPTDVSSSQHRKWGQLERQMKLELVKVQIHASESLYNAASTLYELHAESESFLLDWMLGGEKYPRYEIEHNSITSATANLIVEVRREAKLNERKLGSNLKIVMKRKDK